MRVKRLDGLDKFICFWRCKMGLLFWIGRLLFWFRQVFHIPLFNCLIQIPPFQNHAASCAGHSTGVSQITGNTANLGRFFPITRFLTIPQIFTKQYNLLLLRPITQTLTSLVVTSLCAHHAEMLPRAVMDFAYGHPPSLL